MPTAHHRGSRPLRVALVNDYEIVLRGLAQMFRPYADRVQLVELDARLPVSRPVDLALYDTHGRASEHAVDRLLASPGVGAVVVYGWDDEAQRVSRMLRGRRCGYVSKSLAAAELVTALERVHRHGPLVSVDSGAPGAPGTTSLAVPASVRRARRGRHAWPGREHGLTPREGEVVSLIAQGLSNLAIAELTHLSINSVKSYIRTAYRKMEVESRSQAVLWAVQRGFTPDTLRIDGTTGLKVSS
ncbi:helix-turn-helix transcriptional regulator [Terracoccus luteus]|jgi:DNA-binding NarL/FixJ family response regulator|uniref:DNA-binding NarL/FixJ family response regulator n=1 Tax=Terracoccus luteus TaxID=53356 RepID=A0A839PVJ8_9MICO|nr:response regulator transcription factor [Terracoccus luteus]MBB2986045.1 DNA-binding NarL/FixJ family response regulator [Terracoccus luteus]MCP2171697.1 DNA-binding NarL/FixJ family response regulator [Terracoccus luteus]